MRIVLSLLLLICSLCVVAQRNDITLTGKQAVLVHISYSPKNQYPLSFDIVVSSDTLRINTGNINSVIESVLISNAYMPATSEWVSLYAYNTMFGQSEQTTLDWQHFNMEFNFQTIERSIDKTIKLKDGETLNIFYMAVSGIFWKLKKSEWSKASDTLGIQDFSLVSEILVPVSVINYPNCDNFVIETY